MERHDLTGRVSAEAIHAARLAMDRGELPEPRVAEAMMAENERHLIDLELAVARGLAEPESNLILIPDARGARRRHMMN